MYRYSNCISYALTYLKDELDLETIVKCMSINPRSILQTDIPVIEEGFMANLTVFDTHTNWEFNKENNFSLVKIPHYSTPSLLVKYTALF